MTVQGQEIKVSRTFILAMLGIVLQSVAFLALLGITIAMMCSPGLSEWMGHVMNAWVAWFAATAGTAGIGSAAVGVRHLPGGTP